MAATTVSECPCCGCRRSRTRTRRRHCGARSPAPGPTRSAAARNTAVSGAQSSTLRIFRFISIMFHHHISTLIPTVQPSLVTTDYCRLHHGRRCGAALLIFRAAASVWRDRCRVAARYGTHFVNLLRQDTAVPCWCN